jgi:maltose alpha-D-glucosyltransferase / alpha-amylase
MTTAATIAAWLPSVRWYAGKQDATADVTLYDSAGLPGTAVTLALVDSAAGGSRDRYVMPLVGGADAALSSDFAAWLAQTVFTEATLTADHGVVRGHCIPSPGEPPFTQGTTAVAPLGGDASNTSLLVTRGQRQFAVKLFRRCRDGIQPEVEIGEVLSRDTAWRGTPRLLGWLDYAPTSGGSIVLATVHEFAAGCLSAWDHLGPLVSAGGLAGPRRGAILDVVAALGRVTADMHQALGRRADLPAFAPIHPTAADAQAEASRMAEHATAVFARATSRLETLPTSVAADLRVVLGRRDEIVASLRRWAAIESDAVLIRVHGDYHLGQVLIREPGPEPLVIDFEGEPGRSLEERRRRTTVCKDIAGMCRSFDYLLRHAARSGSTPYRAADLELLEATFLDAYRAVARGQAWWPADATKADALLAVYKLDKAMYELAYELAHRPDWVEVPLAALL